MITRIKLAIRNPNAVLFAALNPIFSVFGHRGFRRFIILAQSRTGSNVLVSFLNNHPHVYVKGEIFGKLSGKNCDRILKKVFSKKPFYVKAAGFKIFYYHPLDDHSGRIWDMLTKMRALHVIHLKRRNLLRMLLSRKIAATAKNYWALSKDRSGQSAEKSVTFTAEELREGFKKTREWENKYEGLFAKHAMLEVYYEDLVGDREHEFKRILDFLGLQYVNPQTHLRKQTPEKTSRLISNYDQLKLEFSGTEWESFFEN